MNESISVLEPVSPGTSLPRGSNRELRREVHNMLRDVAFVLAQTYKIREEILDDQAQNQSSID